MREPHLASYYEDKTSPFFQREGNVVSSGMGLKNEYKVARENPDGWGKDVIIKADYMLVRESALKEGMLREKTLENGIVADVREKAPEIQQILVKEYGVDWHTKAPEAIVARAWDIAEAVNKKEAHGYDVNKVLRQYWEKPEYHKDTGERIYLPEDKKARRELMGKAQYYNDARVETRIHEVNLVSEIVMAKNYKYGDLVSLRDKLIVEWEREDRERGEGCVYELDGDTQRLKLSEVDKRIAINDVLEKKTIIQKIREVAGVIDIDGLLEKIGFKSTEQGDYLIVNYAKGGGRQLVYGRMAQQELMGVCAKGWEGVDDGSEINADVMLMNAIGMESMAKMESAGRELVMGEIYSQRALELSDASDEQLEDAMESLTPAIEQTHNLKDYLRGIFKFAQDLNEVLYTASAAMTNIARRRSEPGSWLRGVGEKMIDWVDRISVLVAPKADKFLARQADEEERSFDDLQSTVSRGKINLKLPEIN